MLNQKLEQKIERGDQIPFFMTTNSTLNKETNSYVLDLDHVWVSNIYKKDLVTLGAKIIRSELGGKIGNTSITDWHFMISRDDYDKIKKQWKIDRLKKFGAKLASGHFDKKRAWDTLKQDITNNFGLITKSKVFGMMDGLEETDEMLEFKRKLSQYRYMSIEKATLLEMMKDE